MGERLAAFLAAGGTLLSFPGVGERDAWGAQTEAPSPGALGPLFGITQDDVYPLAAGIGGTWDSALGRLTNAGEPSVNCVATVHLGSQAVAVDVRHAEIPRPLAADTEVLAVYGAGPAEGRPAITRRRITGTSGQAIFLGAVPVDASAAVALYQALLPGLGAAPAGHTQVKLQTAAGPLSILLNGNNTPAPLPAPVADLLSATTLAELPPWGVAMVRG